MDYWSDIKKFIFMPEIGLDTYHSILPITCTQVRKPTSGLKSLDLNSITLQSDVVF